MNQEIDEILSQIIIEIDKLHNKIDDLKSEKYVSPDPDLIHLADELNSIVCKITSQFNIK